MCYADLTSFQPVLFLCVSQRAEILTFHSPLLLIVFQTACLLYFVVEPGSGYVTQLLFQVHTFITLSLLNPT